MEHQKVRGGITLASPSLWREIAHPPTHPHRPPPSTPTTSHFTPKLGKIVKIGLHFWQHLNLANPVYRRIFLSPQRRPRFSHSHKEDQRWSRGKCLWKVLEKGYLRTGPTLLRWLLPLRVGHPPLWGLVLSWRELIPLLWQLQPQMLCLPPGRELQAGLAWRRPWNRHRRPTVSPGLRFRSGPVEGKNAIDVNLQSVLGYIKITWRVGDSWALPTEFLIQNWGRAWEFSFPIIFQPVLMMRVWGPHFENHCCKLLMSSEGNGNLFGFLSPSWRNSKSTL